MAWPAWQPLRHIHTEPMSAASCSAAEVQYSRVQVQENCVDTEYKGGGLTRGHWDRPSELRQQPGVPHLSTWPVCPQVGGDTPPTSEFSTCGTYSREPGGAGRVS